MKITEKEYASLLDKNQEKGNVLKDVILTLMSNQMAINEKLGGLTTVETIVKRLYHDRLVGYNRALYDTSKTLWERVKAYATPDMDFAYGKAMATRFGFTLPDGANYDVSKYRGDVRIALRGDDLYEFAIYLLSLGAKPQSTDVVQVTDGINHINIYSKSRTSLGKALSMFDSLPERYTTPHGKFLTLEGYYHWLRILEYYETTTGEIELWVKDPRMTDSRLQELRKTDGAESIRLGRKLKKDIYGGTSYRPSSFGDRYLKFLLLALLDKLSKPFNGKPLWASLKAVVDCGVPLYHYYVRDGMPIYPPYNGLLPELYTSIVRHVDPEDDEFDIMSLGEHIDTILHYYHTTWNL